MATGQVNPLLSYIRRLAAPPSAQFSDRELLQRFASTHDENAFAALVRRHGPMVLNVGRRVLHNGDDAEDVFQATFLVLLRKAASLRWKESIGNWLYEVAYRLALKAKTAAARRRLHEVQVPQHPSGDLPAELNWRELQTLLDEELHHLPVSYRVPLILCYLEGATRDEAAQKLGWSLSTFKRRLERGRELLRLRLVRRGLTVSAAFFAPMFTQNTAQATLPAGLARATVRTALELQAGRALAELVSARIAALVEGGLKIMLVTKLKVVIAVLVAAGLFAGAGTLARQVLAASGSSAGTGKSEIGAHKAEPASANQAIDLPGAEEKSGRIQVRGRVLDPEGKPVPGAKLICVYASSRKYPERIWATSGSDGHFRFTLSKAVLEDPWYEDSQNHTYVVAAAKGYGSAVADVPPEASGDLTLRLVHDDVPIEGRLLDLQGRPVAGATIRIDDKLDFPRKTDLSAWLEGLKANLENPGRVNYKHLLGVWTPAFSNLFPPVATGLDGRFVIQGIGRERVVSLLLEGPTIASRRIKAMTRLEQMIRLPEEKERTDGPTITYYGARFELVMPPTKPVVGVLRDKDSGKPLSGIVVRSYTLAGVNSVGNRLLQTRTGPDGRFRLVGLPKGKGNQIVAEAQDLPYFPVVATVPDTPGLEPVTVDIALPRGVWAVGRVTDKVTGKPVTAWVEYSSFPDNPYLKKVGLVGRSYGRGIKDDGSFRTVILPGPGMLALGQTPIATVWASAPTGCGFLSIGGTTMRSLGSNPSQARIQ